MGSTATVFICGPSRALDRRRIKRCPTEGRRRRMVETWAGYWGHDLRCCGCGDHWMDGERLSRPFKPGWREENIARFKAMWEAAPSGPPPGWCDSSGTTRTAPTPATATSRPQPRSR